MATTNVTARVERSLAALIDRKAKDAGVTRSAFAAAALAHGLDDAVCHFDALRKVNEAFEKRRNVTRWPSMDGTWKESWFDESGNHYTSVVLDKDGEPLKATVQEIAAFQQELDGESD